RSTARRASSAHTYRLLIFKDHVRAHHPKPCPLSTSGTASLHVAASAAEKRDYEERLLRRQQVFLTTPPAQRPAKPCPLWLPASPRLLAKARKIEILATSHGPGKRYF
ncbi:hypothetical protein, partial [Paraburkholderia sp.]|uniref:hypothetical protein n=1 Tax=Paraburkholderia sp. TaxID=1926495 RepID=UPI00257EE6E7